MYYDLNPFGIIGATAVSAALGSVWYSSKLFGSQWIQISHWTPEELENRKKEGLIYIIMTQILFTLVQATILNLFISISGLSGWKYGMLGGALAGIGFFIPETVSSVLYDKKPWKWVLIHGSYQMISVMLMGMIMGSLI